MVKRIVQYMTVLNALLIIALMLCIVSCSKRIETGPVEVRWDREVCARCIMAVGDRNYSAQVRGISDDRTYVYFFDDFGCAIHWLSKQAWKDDPRVEVWVNDYRNGEWIDGFTAWYVPGKITPMDYGLGATTEKEDGVIGYKAAVDRILIPDENDTQHKQGHMHP